MRAARKQRGVAVDGSAVFECAVDRLLGELEAGSPRGYRDAIRLMPRLTYAPERLDAAYAFAVLATADGCFAIDGADFELFRWVFLHELGHNVAREQGLGSGELAANRYADSIVAELVEFVDILPLELAGLVVGDRVRRAT